MDLTSGCDDLYRGRLSHRTVPHPSFSSAKRSAEPGTCSGGKRIALPRQKRLPEWLTEDQVRRLLGGVRNPVHRTCLAGMYACGLRISEATALEVTAVDRARRVLRIIGKGDKERLVPLPQPMLEEFEQVWRTHHNPSPTSSTAAPPPLVARSGTARTAARRCSRTIPAATAAARSVTPRRPRNGSTAGRRNCCRCPTSTSPSPCRPNCARCCGRTRRTATRC